MPPIMGAAAFVMAEFLGVSYLTVAGFALLPALLYYVAVFMAVHFEARRIGLVGLPKADLPRLKVVLVERGHLFLPLIVIVAVLLAGYSAAFSALCGIGSVIPTTWLRASTRRTFTFGAIIDALASGARNTLVVALACASAGIVIGTITLTGLGLDFTGVVLAFSGHSLLAALVLTMLAGILLGMGLPTTPAYIVQVALLVPALVKLGVTVEAAHLFVLYFAVLSAITPPVAMAVYAANGISHARLMETSWAAVKLGLTGYIIPFMFVFAPSLLLIGDWQVVLLAVVTATIGVICLAGGLPPLLLFRTRALVGERAAGRCGAGADQAGLGERSDRVGVDCADACEPALAGASACAGDAKKGLIKNRAPAADAHRAGFGRAVAAVADGLPFNGQRHL